MKSLIAILTLLVAGVSQAQEYPTIRSATLITFEISRFHFPEMKVSRGSVSIDEDNKIVRLVVGGVSTLERIDKNGFSRHEVERTIELPITSDVSTRCGTRTIEAAAPAVHEIEENIKITSTRVVRGCEMKNQPRPPTHVEYKTKTYYPTHNGDLTETSHIYGEALRTLAPLHGVPVTL